jgi:RNA polymerase sigma-70 factor (ECF subfamily)
VIIGSPIEPAGGGTLRPLRPRGIIIGLEPTMNPDHPTQTSDGELARQILDQTDGQARTAEETLCRRFAPRVRLYGLRHLRDEAAAADLVQRVLLLTVQKLRAGAVRDPDQIASFVLGSARMITREMRRATRREQPVPPEGLVGKGVLDEQPLDPLPRARLADCLAALGERPRAVVLLSFFQEQSAAEIASALSLQEGNVRVIRHRAIAQLRDCMALEAEEVVS